MKTIIHLNVGARPNFMKIAPLYHQLKKEPGFETVTIHTGQHYDHRMSETFFKDLGLPEPDVNLNVGSGTHAEQTAGVMVAYEKYMSDNPPDWVVVVGDVNSTMACAITAKKMNHSVAHLESGLRSFDQTMPEEINRIVTDSVADVLWTPSADADENLKREGKGSHQIKRVGNIMIDSLVMLQGKIEAQKSWKSFGFSPQKYGVVTLHRPSNTDDPSKLTKIVHTFKELAACIPIVFPLHPRTRKKLVEFDLLDGLSGTPDLVLSEPLGYLEFMSLLSQTRLAVTDSGGIQEETTYMDIPCLTLRENTERPITCTQGTNELIAVEGLADSCAKVLTGQWKKTRVPELWDGKTAHRIVQDLLQRVG